MQPLFPPNAWPNICASVREEMTAFVRGFVTPISISHKFGRGMAWGTGNYIALGSSTYLLTNAHVVEEAEGVGRLGHLPGPTDDYVAFANPLFCAPWPVDLAVTRLDRKPARAIIPAAKLGANYAPAPSELMFWIGYPGSKATRHEPITDLNRRYTWMGGPLETEGVPIFSSRAPGPTFVSSKVPARYARSPALSRPGNKDSQSARSGCSQSKRNEWQPAVGHEVHRI